MQRQLRTPICLDESIHSPEHARWALDIGACQIINIKVGRVGGFTAAQQIHDLCAERGVPVWCGGMLETNIGRAGNLALAALPNFTLPGDISASARYFHHDIAAPEFRAQRRFDHHRAGCGRDSACRCCRSGWLPPGCAILALG